MNDKDKLCTLLNEFGIGYIEESTQDEIWVHLEVDMDKVGGYAGFYSNYRFDLDGNFIEVEIGE